MNAILLRRAALLLLAAPLAACGESARALGATPAEASAHAGEVLTSLAAYFGPVERDARLTAVRPTFAKGALAPSRLFNDTTIWSSHEDDSRTLEIAGSGPPGHYHLSMVASAPPLANPGDYRRDRHLTKLGDSQYEWLAHDDLAIGSITGADFARATDALFVALEHANDASFRAAYREQLPRTTAALSPLCTIDTVGLAPNAAGGTTVHLVIRLHPDSLPPARSRFAKYLDKYARPTELDMMAYDDAGRRWWRVAKAEHRITMDFRVYEGSLAPLSGAVARMPRQVHVRIDFSTKAWIFRVGERGMVGDVLLRGAPHDKAFVARFTHEPHWQLPPLVEQMLRSPLRRPFQDGGVTMQEGVHDAAGSQTLLSSEYRFVLEESGIMRWIGGLGSSAMSDFRQGAEREANLYAYQVLEAMRQDLLALTAPGK